MFPTRQSTARKSISRRLRTGIALAAAAAAIGGAGAGASSAMASTPLGCLDYPAGQLCADDDVGYPGYVLTTATFSDGSQLSVYMTVETWNCLVDPAAMASQPPDSAPGMSALDYVLNHPPSAGSGGGGGGPSVGTLTADVLGTSGAINSITPSGTVASFDPESGMTGTLVNGNLTPTV